MTYISSHKTTCDIPASITWTFLWCTDPLKKEKEYQSCVSLELLLFYFKKNLSDYEQKIDPKNINQWPQVSMCLEKEQQATHMVARNFPEILIANTTI